MAERIGFYGFTPNVGDLRVSAPSNAIFMCVTQDPGLNDYALLHYRHPLIGDQRPYVLYSLHLFGNNETVPDDYFPIQNPIFMSNRGLILYVAQRVDAV